MAVTFQVGFVAGLERARHTRSGVTYDTSNNRARKQLIASAYRNAARAAGHPTDYCAPPRMPVAVDVVTHKPLPISRPKRVTSEPDTTKPDVDNAIKLIFDALNGVAWADDAQVTYVSGRKADRTRITDEHMTITIRRPDWGDR